MKGGAKSPSAVYNADTRNILVTASFERRGFFIAFLFVFNYYAQ